MKPAPAFPDEQRPRDFSARYARSRHVTLAATIRRERSRGHKGKTALALLGAIALPAFAAPGEWDRFEIGDAGDHTIELDPMPFEQAGSSFPGSAFYYLDLETESPAFGEGIRSDADIADRLDPGPKAGALRIDNSGVDRTRAIECLTAAIYYEAASEPDSGQRAVAQVVLNRVAHASYPSTVCGVVYQGSQRRTGCQFSFTCDGSLARKPGRMFWLRAENVARAALAGYVHAPAGLATHYHTTQVSPYWAPSLDYLGTIGAHRFYRFKGSAGGRAAFRFAYRGGEPEARYLRRSATALESAKALDPVVLQRAFDEGLQQAGQENASLHAAPPAAPPAYSEAVKARGGDSLFSGDKLPEATGIKPEFRNSGRWIAKPGS